MAYKNVELTLNNHHYAELAFEYINYSVGVECDQASPGRYIMCEPALQSCDLCLLLQFSGAW